MTDSPPLPRLDGTRALVLFGGSELFGQERANIEVFRNLAELGLKARFVTSAKMGTRKSNPSWRGTDLNGRPPGSVIIGANRCWGGILAFSYSISMG